MNYGNPYSQYPYTGYGMPTYGQRQFVQPQQQMPQQPQMQQQPMQFETPIQDIRFVTSKEAEAFIVMPNTKVLLIDQKGGMAHLKSADNMGQSFAKYFKFHEVNADGSPLEPQEPVEKVDYSGFATKKDLDMFVTKEQHSTLMAQHEAVLQQLEKIQAQIKALKPIPATKTSEAR